MSEGEVQPYKSNSEIDPPTDYDKIIGYILSILFGLVFKDIISDFSKIQDGLNKYAHEPLSFEISSFATVVYCANIFRMLHGYIISLYDKENPTSFGPYPYSFKELIVLILTFIIPLVSASLIIQGSYHSLSILVWYQTPSVIYIFWDNFLRKELLEILKYSSDEKDKRKAKRYFAFVKTWIVLDCVSILLIISSIVAVSRGIMESHYNAILFTFAIVNSGIIFSDYVWINRKFYFRNNGKS